MDSVFDNEFLLLDRKVKIQTVYGDENLETRGYISFSGGKDSTCLHYLFDEAVPSNKIPRVFFDTGLELKGVRRFVLDLAKGDPRFVIIPQKYNIKDTLEKYGYPFKSKIFAHRVDLFRKTGLTDGMKKFLSKKGAFGCPAKLRYLFESKDATDFPISLACCNFFKKKQAREYEKTAGRVFGITGMRQSEGANRKNIGCVLNTPSKKRFNPLAIVEESFIEWYIETRNIKLAPYYYPPFNFNRTGCVGCPYSFDIATQLNILRVFEPSEYKRAWLLWSKVYNEYIKANYRLKNTNFSKLELF